MGYTVVSAAMWSALGPGRFVIRSLVALTFSMVVLVGLLAGLAYMLRSQSEDYRIAVLSITVSYLPVLVAAQIPFWIMRVFFGWQFATEKPKPASFAIKNLLVMTFVIGLAFATPAIVTEVVFDSYEIEPGTVHYLPDESSRGNFSLDSIEVTSDNISDVRKRQHDATRQQTNMMMLIVSIFCLLLSLTTLPFIGIVFRSQRQHLLLFIVLYAFAVFGLIAVCCLRFMGGNYFFRDVAIPMMTATIFSSAIISIPLLISKSKGFHLYSNKQVRSQIAEQN